MPSDGQPDRATLLCATLAALGLLGLVGALWPSPASVPGPCAKPTVSGDLLQCEGQGEAVGARVWLAGGALDLNAATRQDLRALPGVGPKTAAAILQDREKRGAFPSVDALGRVKGIGPKTVVRLRPWVRTDAP